MPQWAGTNAVRFLKIAYTDGWFRNTFCEIDLTTGEEKKLADLYNAGGQICPVFYWQTDGEEIYYTTSVAVTKDKPAGFFKSLLLRFGW